VHELNQGPIRANYPQGRVLGIDEFGSGLNDPPQGGLQLNASGDRNDSREQATVP
jgi:hypothetical protein